MIRFEPITQDNMNDAIAISVHPDQEDIIAPVVYSLAQCYVLSDILTPFLIMNDDLPVGFILFLIAPKEEEYELCRLMIAQKQQKKAMDVKLCCWRFNTLRMRGRRKSSFLTRPTITELVSCMKVSDFITQA